jgi:hypothetical protein
MPSFILRDLNPDFWQRVQAKAVAEGVTVKALILRLLTVWLATGVVLLGVGCGYQAPAAPTPAAPIADSVPYTVALGGVASGTVAGETTMTAHVQNVKGAPLAGTLVTFTTDVGELTAASVMTGASGNASTIITATRTAAITATAGTVTSHTSVTSPPISAGPAPTPTPAPGPNPTPTLPGPLGVTLSATSVTLGTETTLSAQVTGSPQRFAWAFGDGPRISTARWGATSPPWS